MISPFFIGMLPLLTEHQKRLAIDSGCLEGKRSMVVRESTTVLAMMLYDLDYLTRFCSPCPLIIPILWSL